MKRKALILFFLWVGTGWAWADRWDFLPAGTLFSPLIGDLLEVQDAIVARPDQNHFDGMIGDTIEFLRWRTNDNDQWAWGIEGASLLQLASKGAATYPLVASNWYLGTYFSAKTADLSHRLEYEHVSAHLGDSLFYNQDRIIYSRESFKWTSSWDVSPYLRLYGGPCYWSHLSPDTTDSRFYFHVGMEFYTDYFRTVFDTHFRGYFTYNVLALGEAGGVIDQTVEVGVQWRWKRDTSQSIRMAAVFYTGNSEYGQFYQDPDTYWGLGIFFQP